MAITEKLIESIKKYPILYDLADDDYKNTRKKDKLWQQIGLELEENGYVLKKKWKNLRDSYAKHLRCLKTPTGQGGREKLHKWQWAKQMEAFRPFMPSSQTPSNIRNITENTDGETDRKSISPSSGIEQEEQSSDFEINNVFVKEEQSSTSEENPVSEKRFKHHEQAFQETPTSAVIKYLKEKHRSRPNVSDLDAIDLIFSGYAKTVKTFSPGLQVKAKLKIAELMSQLELEHHQERTSFVPYHLNARCSSTVSHANK